MEFNPVIEFREIGKERLRKELEPISIEELKKMIKAWCPDINKTIYRTKKKERVINYILERSEKLSELGQCFRYCSNGSK